MIGKLGAEQVVAIVNEEVGVFEVQQEAQAVTQ
jgi:hypothetical protein